MSGGKAWSAADERRLRRLWPTTPTVEIARRMGRTLASVRSRGTLLGLHKEQGRRCWTKAEDRELRRLYANTPLRELKARFKCPERRIYNRAHRLGLTKKRECIKEQGRRNSMHPRAVGHRFAQGHVPANKGLRRPGYARGRMRETMFKPGHKPQTWKPIGTEVVDGDGYRKVKVTDDRMPVRRNWRHAHVMLWETLHGPVPAGYAVAFVNGDKTDIRIENLHLVCRAEIMRQNTIHNLPEPLKEIIHIRAGLVRRINHQRRRA